MAFGIEAFLRTIGTGSDQGVSASVSSRGIGSDGTPEGDRGHY